MTPTLTKARVETFAREYCSRDLGRKVTVRGSIVRPTPGSFRADEALVLVRAKRGGDEWSIRMYLSRSDVLKVTDECDADDYYLNGGREEG